MRIRKRKQPFTLSDPHPPLVQPPNQPTGDQTSRFNPSDHVNKKEEREVEVEVEDELKVHDSRRKIELSGEMSIALQLPQSNQSLLQDGKKWCEEDKSFPLKKRRGFMDDVDQKNTKPKTSTKRLDNSHKKEVVVVVEEEVKKKEKYQEGIDSSSGLKKRGRARGGVLMEGSRCSRVNGRGWRCCQQTLVGYSLCEHHLGKGRVRTLSSVKNRNRSCDNDALGSNDKESNDATTTTLMVNSTSSLQNVRENDIGESSNYKRRAKLGVVKARSMSSLLGQKNDVQEK